MHPLLTMKSGYISIIGKPNVGKSTLLNRLLKFKLSIVSKKPQTTRKRILGILTQKDCQCYFLDTPGIVKPQYELQEKMINQIRKAVIEADIIIWIIEPWFKHDYPANFTDFFKKKPVLCVINKIDLVPKKELLPVIDQVRSLPIKEIIPLSALTGEGIELCKKKIFEYLPKGHFLYPENDISDKPERFFTAELIREEIFKYFQEEIPYSTCVLIDQFVERTKAKDFIRAIIYVEKQSQKGIIIGKKGAALKKIGAAARNQIEKFLGRKIYLELWVKVKEKWRKDKKFLKELGY
jgi:GTP-binding protein Era